MQLNAGSSDRPEQTNTITPQASQQPINQQAQTPSTPGIYLPFNWEEFESRYEKALLDADSHERELAGEFDLLVKVSFPPPHPPADGTC